MEVRIKILLKENNPMKVLEDIKVEFLEISIKWSPAWFMHKSTKIFYGLISPNFLNSSREISPQRARKIDDNIEVSSTLHRIIETNNDTVLLISSITRKNPECLQTTNLERAKDLKEMILLHANKRIIL